jgi:phosphomannomutase
MANLRETLTFEPHELKFGTSGLRGLVTDMTDLECYINTVGFLRFEAESGELKPGGVVYLAGDLRESTPRILRAVATALRDEGYKAANCGLIPTPAVSLWGFKHGKPSIMVTGSHIPADRNGIKFVRAHDEVLKEHEPAIKAAVAGVREALYGEKAAESRFGADGMLKEAMELPEAKPDAAENYSQRYMEVFGGRLKGKKLVFYQHSAVGRDLLVKLFEDLGATVVPVGRSDVFVPIDSENVRLEDEAYFAKMAEEHPDMFAMVSTDGDSDRPFVVDENGEFHRGDMLGVVVAHWLGADAAAYPVSASDATDQYLTDQGISWEHTRIGSPFVIAAMKKALAAGKKRVVSWEVNGGFLTDGGFEIDGHMLAALPTRDAFLPILVAILAASDKQQKVSELFAALPQRFTQAGLINNFPTEVSAALVKKFSRDDEMTRGELEGYFSRELGFGQVSSINTLDGVRLYFSNGDIAHLRPSGNAPQLRIYSVAGTQKRADEIVAAALAEPDGIFRRMERALKVEAEAAV